jgi:RNA 2',3'-cyclic 3'-phosphodiesterase
MKRLFVGIAIAPEAADELRRIVAALKPQLGNLRWSDPEGWHITLQFLGMTDDEREGCIREQLRQLRAEPVPVRIEGIGAFARAGVLYAGVAESWGLSRLQRRVTAATASCGVAAEERAYHPHITLARGREENALRSYQRQRVGQFAADSFQLYESVTGREGARYLVVERFGLGRGRG